MLLVQLNWHNVVHITGPGHRFPYPDHTVSRLNVLLMQIGLDVQMVNCLTLAILFAGEVF